MKTNTPRIIGLSLLLAARLLAVDTPTAEAFQAAKPRPVDLEHDRNLYVVGYSHLDTQWRWTYPQVTREFIADTLRDNFSLFEKFPNYVFNFSGSRRYEMMAEYYPAEFAKMKTLVAAGRWFPAGSSVDEADAMVPSAESLQRHILYGNRYFRRELGVASEEFMLPDCFGFPAGLPSILAHAGLKGFSTQKLTWGSSVGIPFKVGVWEGPDGNSVVAALDPGGYAALLKEDPSRSESWLARINATGAASGAYVDYRYVGTGDRGGAPAESSIRWVERGIAGQGPIRVLSSKADQLFKDLKPEQISRLPRYQGELLLTQHSAGSITSQAYMKRWNRKNELLATAAERASVAALVLGAAPYPERKLYEAWDLLLGSQMHDMLPGTSLPKAYEYCWNDELLAANFFGAALTNGIGAIADGLDTQTQGIPLVVFNPLSIAREDVVEAKIRSALTAGESIEVHGPDGKNVAAQVLEQKADGTTIAFVARVPGLSFVTFEVRTVQAKASTKSELKANKDGLENEYYRVVIAPDGDVASIFDKRAGRELLSSPLRLAFLSEKPEQYPAWNMDWSDRQKAPRAYVDGPATVRVTESGPARVAVEIAREAEGSRFVQTIRLAAGGAADRVELATQIDWQTPGSSLKAVFPLAIANPVATYDSQLGTLIRGNNEPKKYEVPQHQWFDLDAPDHSFGISVLNDSKFGSDKPDDRTLRLTLLYTPAVRSQYQDQATQDFGRHEMVYAVTSHAGDWRSAQVPWTAARLNQPLLAFQATAHLGKLGKTFALFEVSNPQVIVDAVKRAEDGNDIVVRLRELTGQPAKAVQLKTTLGLSSVRELDGQERTLGSMAVEAGAVTFDVRGYGLKTLALKIDQAEPRIPATTAATVSLAYNADVVSTNANRADGQVAAAGKSFPAEQLPAKIISEGIEFVTGPTADGKLNAVAAEGQRIALPEGNYDRLYLLAAAEDDVAAKFTIDGKPTELTIQRWTGYVGQWDNREWEGQVPELGYSWFNPLAGLTPGYVKHSTVAWYASHRHMPSGDDHYQYSYLFKYRLDLPRGAKALVLPNDRRILVFALSVARNAHDEVSAATPLFDQLGNRITDAPAVTPAGGNFTNATAVTLTPPLYWHKGGLRYTVDGSIPTTTSPVYDSSLWVDRKVTVKAAEFDAMGHSGPVVTAQFEVNDKTPPTAISAAATSLHSAVRITFSEPISKESAENAGNYRLDGSTRVIGAKRAEDASHVMLTLSEAVSGATHIEILGVRDTAPTANQQAAQSLAVEFVQPAFVWPAAQRSGEIKHDGLPVGKAAAWTMNAWVRSSAPIENRTLIAGFGRLSDKTNNTGHYFAVFANGIHVWGSRKAHLESTRNVDFRDWQMLTASYDGTTLRLFVNAKLVSWTEAALDQDEAIARVGGLDPWDHERKFPGDVQDFAVWPGVISNATLEALFASGPGK